MGAAQKSLDVDAGGEVAAGEFGDGLGHVAAAALVAVAHRLLRATQHQVDVAQVEALHVVQQLVHGQCAGDLAAEILQQYRGGEGFVLGVARLHHPHGGAFTADEEWQAIRCLQCAVQLSIVEKRRRAGGQRRRERRGRQHGTHLLPEPFPQQHVLERVRAGQQGEETPFLHDVPEGRLSGLRLGELVEPGLLHLPQTGRRLASDEHLVGQVAAGFVVAPQGPLEVAEELGARLGFPERLRAVPHQARGMRQHGGGAPDDGFGWSTWKEPYNVREGRARLRTGLGKLCSDQLPASKNGALRLRFATLRANGFWVRFRC